MSPEFQGVSTLFRCAPFILFLLTFSKMSIAVEHDISEDVYFQEFPVVLSASRLKQPQNEAPNAMTVIDRDMIKASGFRTIPDLFRLVPGMYVSYFSGWQPIVAYHGTTDQAARRMQVLVDGRTIHMPPVGDVAWEDLPLQLDDIERIEVIRGPAAASYGGNSTQGVINIITRDASSALGFKATVIKGNGGIGGASVGIGASGEKLDYRLSMACRKDDGYDAQQVAIDAFPTINNDSYRTRLFNLRGNYHPNISDSFDIQLGYTNGNRGDGTANPFDPNSPHDRHNHENFSQVTWIHNLGDGDEVKLQYYHIYQDVLNAVPPVGPFPALSDSWTNTRDEWELQHTINTSFENRLVWGASSRRDWTRAPNRFLEEQSLHQTSLFAHDEWRMKPQWLMNVGAMQEDNGMGERNISPRLALIYKASDRQTLRLGISKAYRNPSMYEERGNYHFPALGATLAQSSGGLSPESVLSREIGYLGEFPEQSFSADVRFYHDKLRNIIFETYTNPTDFANLFDATHRGVEITTKHNWNEKSQLTFNYTWQLLSSDFVGYSGTPYSDTMPRNMISMLYTRKFAVDHMFSLGYYQQDTTLAIDRPAYDRQQLTRRADIRIAKAFGKRSHAEMEGEVAFVVQGLFASGHIDYMDSNLFRPRAFVTAFMRY